MLPRLTRRLLEPSGMWDLLDDFQRDLSQLAHRLQPVVNGGWAPADVEVWEDDQNVYVQAELPGVKPQDVDITLEGGLLTIRGHKKQDEQSQQATYHLRQRRYGEFAQQLQLPTSADPSKVSAAMKDGVLSLTIEKRPEVKARRIEVKAE